MSLYQIVYASRNCIAGSPEQVEAEIQAILAASRKNNVQDGITGALLFNGSGFAQVLEGSLDTVERTFERIQCDSRHNDVVMLGNGSCADRTFSDWSMAYADPMHASAGSEPIDLDEICANPERGANQILEALRRLIGT